MINAQQSPITDYVRQAHGFLQKAYDYLEQGDLHQASEKGWGAASHMAKAVGLAQNWPYENHSEYRRLMRQATEATGNDHLRFLHGRAEQLHMNYYEREQFLDIGTIRQDIDGMRELLTIMEPLLGNRAE